MNFLFGWQGPPWAKLRPHARQSHPRGETLINPDPPTEGKQFLKGKCPRQKSSRVKTGTFEKGFYCRLSRHRCHVHHLKLHRAGDENCFRSPWTRPLFAPYSTEGNKPLPLPRQRAMLATPRACAAARAPPKEFLSHDVSVRVGESRLVSLGQTKVKDLQDPILGEADVAGFQVPGGRQWGSTGGSVIEGPGRQAT